MSCKYCDETKAFKINTPIYIDFPYIVSYMEDLGGWVLYNPNSKNFALQLPYGYIGELPICLKCGRNLRT